MTASLGLCEGIVTLKTTKGAFSAPFVFTHMDSRITFRSIIFCVIAVVWVCSLYTYIPEARPDASNVVSYEPGSRSAFTSVATSSPSTLKIFSVTRSRFATA